MSKSRRGKTRYPSKDELNELEAMKARSIPPRVLSDVEDYVVNIPINPNQQEDSKMENNNNATATETVPQQPATATTTQTAQPVQTTAPAASAPAAQPQMTVQCWINDGSQKTKDVLDRCDANLHVYAESHNAIQYQAFAEEVQALMTASKSAEEFEVLFNQKLANINNTNGGTNMNANATVNPAAVNPTITVAPQQPMALPQLTNVCYDRSSFSEWTTTEKIVVGVGVAALVGVSIWAIVATVKANKYKAALADAVAGSGM